MERTSNRASGLYLPTDQTGASRDHQMRPILGQSNQQQVYGGFEGFPLKHVRLVWVRNILPLYSISASK